MTDRTTRRARGIRLLAFTMVIALVAGLALAFAPVLAREQAQARALVTRGEHALVTGDRAAGVLDIERARLLAPRADFVRAAARTAAIHDPETPVTRALRFVSSREWGALATALGWFAGLSVALAIARKRSKTAWKVALAATTGFFAAMLGVAQSSLTATAVVTAPDAHALVAPYPGAAPAGPLPAGTIVVRGPEHGQFVRVRSSDGLEGWTPAESVQPVAHIESS